MKSRYPLLFVIAVIAAGCSYQPVDFAFLNTEPESIDPSLSSGVPDSRIVRALFCGLTSSHPETLADLPELATHWETSEDGITWTFHLRDAVWTDGLPITADDFVWTHERILNPASEAKFLDQFYVIRNAERYNKGEVTDFGEVGIHAPDPKTVVYTLDAPVPFFTQLTSFEPFFPVPRQAIEKWGTSFWTKPGKIVSSGPFMLDEWRFRERIVLAKNPTYWDAKNVRLNRVAAIPTESENTGFTLYETGLADWAERTYIPLSHILDDIKGRPDFQSADYLGTYYISVNTTYKPFDDLRIRQAFSMAIDRRAIVEQVTRAGEKPAYTFVYPDMPGYNSPDARLVEDRKRARELLAEAGYPDGKGLPYIEYLYNTNEQHKAIAEVLQKQWEEALGVHVELRNAEWQVYLEEERQLAHKGLARSAWIGDYLDASTFLRLMTSDSGNNYTGFKRKEYDELVHGGLREPDVHKRLELFQRAERMVIEELPVIPLYFYVQVKLVRPWVKGDPGNLLSKFVLKWMWIDEAEKARWKTGKVPAIPNAKL